MAVRADVAVFTVGAFLFVAGLAGIYTLPEEDGNNFTTFTVGWSEQARDLDIASVSLLDGEELEESFTLAAEDALDATVIRFDVACSDNAVGAGVAPASLSAVFQGPGNLTGDASGTCGEAITVSIRAQDAPTADRAAGENEADAKQRLLNQRATGDAVGNWSVTLTLTRPGGLPDLTQTGGADVEITSSITYFEPQLTAVPR